MRPITIRLHYNKQGAAQGKPWTIHTSKDCWPAAHVVFSAVGETEYLKNKKKNPRAFLKFKGFVTWVPGDIAHISSLAPKGTYAGPIPPGWKREDMTHLVNGG